MPLLAEFRDRLGLPSRASGEGERDDGFGPQLGIILPGTFPPPAVVAPPGSEPSTPGAPAPYPPPGSQPPAKPPKALVGGRLSWDDQLYFGSGLPVILPPDLERDEWRRLDLDASRIQYLPTHTLLKVLAEASPDVSRALWDFLRLTNPGWTCTAYRVGTHTPEPEAQTELDAWTSRLRLAYGSVDVPIGRLHFGAFLRGAIFSELVLDVTGHTALDLATPDPITARFRQMIDPVLGRKWALGQYQLGTFVDLSVRQTISYIPIDPPPGNPYGRPPCAPAIFASLFLIGLLHDLRRVVAQQGYPRYDLAIVIEQLKKATPQNIINNPLEWKAWVDQTITDVQNVYSQLQPDDAFVHTDVVTVNRPTGAISAEALSGIDPLVRALERQLARALKTMPLLMGIVEGQSEANANRQWELQAAGIKAIQHLSESQLSQWGVLVCQAKGIPADVEWKFAELRAAETYRDAMTEGLEIDNVTKKYLMGWIGQKEAAAEITGEEPDQSEPRFLPANETPYDESPAAKATTTGSPRGDGQPAGSKPGGDNTGGDNQDVGDSKDPNARRRPFDIRLRWPTLPFGRARATEPPQPWRPHGQPLAFVPTDVSFDESDRARALHTWDAELPEYAGLLDARLAGPEDEDEAELRRELAAASPNGKAH